jgi:uncharacterized membrane protein YfcA
MLPDIILYAIFGFIAQMIDGALGMAYGVSSTTLLLGMGVPPVSASASVHTAEVFTTLVSGIAHHRLGNVNKRLFVMLALPGAVGGVLGAWVLSLEAIGSLVKPGVSVYLIVIGAVILYKALARLVETREAGALGKKVYGLGFAGGLMDAMGGGGWGPIVTSTMIAGGNHPQTTIGSVNAAEFFVTLAQVTTFAFFLTNWLEYGQIILGLLIGGVLAAPLAALVSKRARPRNLMIGVGILIILTNVYTLWKLFAAR